MSSGFTRQYSNLIIQKSLARPPDLIKSIKIVMTRLELKIQGKVQNLSNESRIGLIGVWM